MQKKEGLLRIILILKILTRMNKLSSILRIQYTIISPAKVPSILK